MADAPEVVIVAPDGTEHVFPPGFNPKRAAAIVRGGQTVASTGNPRADMVTMMANPGFLRGQQDAALVAADQLPAAGATVGSVVGGVPGSFVGGAAGKSVQQGLRALAGEGGPASLGEAAKNVAADAVINGMVIGGTHLLGKTIAKAIPSLERASGKFQDVMGAAKDVPVSTHGHDAALRVYQLSERGASMPKPVRDYLKRATDPSKADLTYGELRDFYSNITRLSSKDMASTNRVVRREIAALARELNDSLARAAESVGKGDTYRSAMREFAQAAGLRDANEALRGAVKNRTVQGAVGAGIGAAAINWLRDITK